jgi:hypothetical protein
MSLAGHFKSSFASKAILQGYSLFRGKASPWHFSYFRPASTEPVFSDFAHAGPNGPMAVTWVTYSPDFAQWKWDVFPGRTMTLPGGYASTFSPSN